MRSSSLGQLKTKPAGKGCGEGAGRVSEFVGQKIAVLVAMGLPSPRIASLAGLGSPRRALLEQSQPLRASQPACQHQTS